MCEDHKGCVFDVPSQLKDDVTSLLSTMQDVEISVPNELPTLVDVNLREQGDNASGFKRRYDSREGPGAKRGRNGFVRNSDRGRFGNRGEPRYGREKPSNGFARKFQASRKQY